MSRVVEYSIDFESKLEKGQQAAVKVCNINKLKDPIIKQQYMEKLKERLRVDEIVQ